VLLVVLDCPSRLLSEIECSGIAERVTLALLVAEFAGDRKVLLVILDRPPRLAQSAIPAARIAKRVVLAPPVTELAASLEPRLKPSDPDTWGES
jgi:hypothetical protein